MFAYFRTSVWLTTQQRWV